MLRKCTYSNFKIQTQPEIVTGRQSQHDTVTTDLIASTVVHSSDVIRVRIKQRRTICTDVITGLGTYVKYLDAGQKHPAVQRSVRQ